MQLDQRERLQGKRIRRLCLLAAAVSARAPGRRRCGERHHRDQNGRAARSISITWLIAAGWHVLFAAQSSSAAVTPRFLPRRRPRTRAASPVP